MKKIIIYCFLFSHTLLIGGQDIRTIIIDAQEARPINLSEIFENVTPIVLEKQTSIQNIFFTNEYLFVAAIGSVIQYDLSGKYVRTIDCGGYVTNNIGGDKDKKEIFVPVGDKIRSYNYSGMMKKEYSLKSSSIYCLYHNSVLWVLLEDFQSDSSIIYSISKVNPVTGQATALPFEKKVEPIQLENGSLVSIGTIGGLSLHNDEVVVSFAFEKALYKIQQDRIIPFIQWDVSPPAGNADVNSLKANGYTGDHLFINYRRDDQFYIYIENIKTGKTYNVSNLIDDVFHTNRACNIRFMHQGYYYFIKERSDIKGNSIGNIPLKNGPVIFIVKSK